MAQTPTMVRRRRWLALLSAQALVGPGLPVLGALPAHAATTAKPFDFDGDGFADLVVGAPRLDVGSHDGAGGVVLLTSKDTGPFSRTTLTQSTAKVAGKSEAGDAFGSAVVSADFDRDGFADLAVGLPGEDLGRSNDAGAVTVLYGSAAGLTAKRSKQLAEPSGRSGGARFGEVLAAGDVSGDGYPDLVVSAPDEDVDLDDFNRPGGSVTVLLGGSQAVQKTGYRKVQGVRSGTVDPGFGSQLAVGDVDGDGRPDVVVASAIRPEVDHEIDGSITYCAGKDGGPTVCRRIQQGAELDSIRSVAVGNVAGDARPEILVGVPFLGTAPVQVLTLTGTGTSTTATRHGFDPPRPQRGRFDVFGFALAVSDLDGDGYDDLVAGAPGTSVDDEFGAGRVYVVPGGNAGLDAGRMVTYDENTPGVKGGAEAGDQFGAALTLVDVTRDGRPDLTVGAPDEDNDLGSVTTLYGVDGGFTTKASVRFDPSIVAPDQARLSFGATLGR
jgi:FG-GAP-like repeat/FG-GAP repeat